jgi:hypothetical protein
MQNLIRCLFLLLFFCICLSSPAPAQIYEKKILEYVRKISEGRSEQVVSKLPDLMKKMPNHAGLIYIEGLVASDENESIRCFKMISDSFPHSEWADDALVRMFEYYESKGMWPEAETRLEKLTADYPNSPYLKTNYLSQVSFTGGDTIPQPTVERRQGTEFAIQVGAFAIRKNAEKLQRQFAAGGYRADVYENLLDGKNLLYLVWIGSYPTMEDAQAHLKEIKTKFNIDGVLRPRSNWKRW